MKFISNPRLLTIAFALVLLLHSAGYAQDRAQMDSLYATVQRAILKIYPKAVFPPILYDKYEIATIDNEGGTVDAIGKLTGELHDEYGLIFPEFTRWDIESDEAKKDPLHRVYVFVSFYVLDPTAGLMQGYGSATLLHKKKKASAPDQFTLEYPTEPVIWTDYPTPIEPYQCEDIHASVPADHPLYMLITEHCPEEEEYDYDE